MKAHRRRKQDIMMSMLIAGGPAGGERGGRPGKQDVMVMSMLHSQ